MRDEALPGSCRTLTKLVYNPQAGPKPLHLISPKENPAVSQEGRKQPIIRSRLNLRVPWNVLLCVMLLVWCFEGLWVNAIGCQSRCGDLLWGRWAFLEVRNAS